MSVPRSNFNEEAMRGLAASYPDQDILDQAMAYDPTDVRQSAAFSTNHVSGNAHHSFIADSHKKEQLLGRSRRLKLWDAALSRPSTVPE